MEIGGRLYKWEYRIQEGKNYALQYHRRQRPVFFFQFLRGEAGKSPLPRCQKLMTHVDECRGVSVGVKLRIGGYKTRSKQERGRRRWMEEECVTRFVLSGSTADDLGCPHCSFSFFFLAFCSTLLCSFMCMIDICFHVLFCPALFFFWLYSVRFSCLNFVCFSLLLRSYFACALFCFPLYFIFSRILFCFVLFCLVLYLVFERSGP